MVFAYNHLLYPEDVCASECVYLTAGQVSKAPQKLNSARSPHINPSGSKDGIVSRALYEKLVKINDP